MTILQNVKRITGHNVKKLGAGAFSTAFRSLDNDTVVFIVSPYDDQAKDILSHIDNKYVPFMSSVDYFTYRGNDYTIWQTTYSTCPKKSDGLAYTQWQTLSKLWDSLDTRFYRLDKDMWYSVVGDYIDMLRETDLDEELIDAMDMIYSWATAFGPNFKLEFPRCNLGVTADGTLQLRDIVFFR